MDIFSIEAYDYELDESLIAHSPCKKRDCSRLMVVDRGSGSFTHTIFSELHSFLRPGDIIVRNNSRVFPARLHGRRRTGGKVEFLLLSQASPDTWEVLSRPARRLQPGETVVFSEQVQATIVESREEGMKLVRFQYNGDFFAHLDRIGAVPLPPYINPALSSLSRAEVQDRYQTVYAVQTGSAAAPTAGLHFTRETFVKLNESGVDVRDVTLHVGLGTFRPLSVSHIMDHRMHEEQYHIEAGVVSAIRKAKEQGRRVIAVGTTSVRVLESLSNEVLSGDIRDYHGKTSVYIYPGYEFRIVDGLITNFHLPRSSLLLLVSAFAGRETVLRAYAEAQRERYRFFSFGDAMLIV